MDLKIVRDFIESVNSSNIDKIYNLMTKDHEFIDTQGNKMNGNDNLKKAWIRIVDKNGSPIKEVVILDKSEIMVYAYGPNFNILPGPASPDIKKGLDGSPLWKEKVWNPAQVFIISEHNEYYNYKPEYKNWDVNLVLYDVWLGNSYVHD